MADDREKEEGKGFKVQDRRRFSPETGEPLEKTSSDQPEVGPAESEPASEPDEETRKEAAGAGHETLPITFSTFIISLSTQALMHLGEIPNPLNGKVDADVPVAKQMIDIIGMLQEKSRGNLDQGEAKLMEDVLFDLRMKYVHAVRGK